MSLKFSPASIDLFLLEWFPKTLGCVQGQMASSGTQLPLEGSRVQDNVLPTRNFLM